MSAGGPQIDLTLHASCVLLDESGILIRGAAGSGKSSLCLALVISAASEGRFARLVADDRVRLSVRHGRLVARPHPSLAGLVEIRGAGLHRMARTAPAAVIRLVVDLVDAGERFPDDSPHHVTIAGLAFPCLRLERSQPREYLIREAIAAADLSVGPRVRPPHDDPAASGLP